MPLYNYEINIITFIVLIIDQLAISKTLINIVFNKGQYTH